MFEYSEAVESATEFVNLTVATARLSDGPTDFYDRMRSQLEDKTAEQTLEIGKNLVCLKDALELILTVVAISHAMKGR